MAEIVDSAPLERSLSGRNHISSNNFCWFPILDFRIKHSTIADDHSSRRLIGFVAMDMKLSDPALSRLLDCEGHQDIA
jgi:hypothetical protein